MTVQNQFEYRAIPAPRKGKSAKGVRGTEAKFANALSVVMNEMGSDGWEYLRADTLPCEERKGLTGRTVKYHSMLVFRRPVTEAEEEIADAAEALTPLIAAPAAIPDETEIAAPAAISEQADEPPLTMSADQDLAEAAEEDDEDENGERSTVAAE